MSSCFVNITVKEEFFDMQRHGFKQSFQKRFISKTCFYSLWLLNLWKTALKISSLKGFLDIKVVLMDCCDSWLIFDILSPKQISAPRDFIVNWYLFYNSSPHYKPSLKLFLSFFYYHYKQFRSIILYTNNILFFWNTVISMWSWVFSRFCTS